MFIIIFNLFDVITEITVQLHIHKKSILDALADESGGENSLRLRLNALRQVL